MAPSTYTIQYHITSRPMGDDSKLILQIWETVPGSHTNGQALLYQINYELQSDQGACTVINHLLESAGATQLTDYQFSKLQGRLKVHPNPTLRR